MKCGRCSASCPSYDEYGYPSASVRFLRQNVDVEPLLKSEIHLEMPLLLSPAWSAVPGT
ncbi:MAG: hypothetical protein ACLUD2_10555 [Clostridium sp.]